MERRAAQEPVDAQRELDGQPVVRLGQVDGGEGLEPTQPVAQRRDVDVRVTGRRLEVPAVPDDELERPDEVAPAARVVVRQRPDDRVGEGHQAAGVGREHQQLIEAGIVESEDTAPPRRPQDERRLTGTEEGLAMVTR